MASEVRAIARRLERRELSVEEALPRIVPLSRDGSSRAARFEAWRLRPSRI